MTRRDEDNKTGKTPVQTRYVPEEEIEHPEGDSAQSLPWFQRPVLYMRKVAPLTPTVRKT